MKLILLILLFAFNISYAQEVRCSTVNSTIGYSYVYATDKYEQSVKSMDRVKICMGPETIAIGQKTSFYMGKAINEVRDKDGLTYRMYATNEKDQHLILEIWFSNQSRSRMVVTAIFPKLYYIEYYVEQSVE
ncbi:hypothetical protein [Hymenobacter psychrophilus]|uniref:DUF4468 domain-containing protein n=1 Tax=Hymenobacter psychrophilus TaxID=651662 RepID=A0A1H3NFU1_9BACT|nr:hypothetical protein [Hymenobacter psychrophilus]SDY87325.1 hypothetical protein SAMN04488069_11666 [Hymenobacter psychrophilus]